MTLRRQGHHTARYGLPPALTKAKRVCDRRTSGIVTAIPEFIAHPGTRHPERFPDAINLVRQAGLSISHAPQGKSPPPARRLWLAIDGRVDVTVWHCRSRLCWRFMVERGGHNPLEAAAHAIPVLWGRILLTLKTFARGWSRQAGDYRYRCHYACKRGFLFTHRPDYRSFYGRHAVEVLYQNQGRYSVCFNCWNLTCHRKRIEVLCKNGRFIRVLSIPLPMVI